MNTVNLKNVKKNPVYERGSLWRDGESNIYILASVAQGYAAICLEDGVLWNYLTDAIESATKGLTFVANSGKITVEV
jgi:hypothetical protein